MRNSVILIIEQFADQYQSRISAEHPGLEVRTVSHASEIGSKIIDVAALFGFGPSFDDALIQRAKSLEWIQFLSSGTDALSRLPSLGRDIVVTSTHGVHGPSVSEMAFMHMLVLARNYARVRQNQNEAKWDEFDQPLLFKKTIAIVGTGVIAVDLARRCKAFDMTVLGVSRTPRKIDHFDAVLRRSQLPEVAAKADFLVLLAPLTPETTGIVNADILNAMKSSAYLINVARGPICDETALLAALRDKRIAGAGLDAFCVEPLPALHPFWRMENVTITPHIAGRNDCYADLVMPILLHNLKCFVDGRMTEMVNTKVRPQST